MSRVRSVSVGITLVVACSLPGTMVTGQSPLASPTATDAAAIPDLGSLTPAEIDALSAGLLAADLERFGVSAFDGELPGILAELRQASAQDLRDILSVQEQPDVPGAEGQSGLIASLAGAPPVRRNGTSDQGGELLGVLGSMVVEVGSYIEDVHPGPGAANIAPPPYQKSGTQTVGGRQVGTQQRVVVKQGLDHSVASISREVSETYAIPGKDGQLQATVEDSATVIVRIEVCPDDQGVIRGRVETHAETRFTAPNGPGYHALFTGSDILRAQVNDESKVSASQHTEQAQRRATGHRPAFGDEPARDTDATLGVSSTHSIGADGQEAGTTTVTQEDGADMADLRIATFVTGITREVATNALRAAATVWRSGRCLKVVATPAGQKVQPGSQTSINVTIRHVVEERDVPRKVRATLSGDVSISPSDTPFDTPGTVTFAAPWTQARSGITFKTVSNRGIAQVTETYEVDPDACPPPGGEARPLIARLGGADGLDGGPFIAQADPTCPPEAVVLEGDIHGQVTFAPKYEFDSGGSVTIDAHVWVTGPRGYGSRFDQQRGDVSIAAEFTGDCVASVSWHATFEATDAGFPTELISDDGTHFAEISITDGPVGQAGGPVDHAERLDISIRPKATVDVTCGTLQPPEFASYDQPYMPACPDSKDVLTDGAFIVQRTGPGQYQGECSWDTGDDAQGTGSWSAEFHEVSP